jgi:hypothetical protein
MADVRALKCGFYGWPSVPSSWARTLLLDADAEAASALLRAWGSTVRAAAALWEAFPQVRESAIPDTDPFPRVREIARSVDVDLATSRWPGTRTGTRTGTGTGDHRMHAISGNLTRARELVDKYGGELQRHLPACRRTSRRPAPASCTPST